ncbi:MAG: SDR family oxidoreductase [Pseudomonadota bacterium]
MNLNLTGQRIFVTAGAAGIGRVIVQTLTELGAQVATCDIDEVALESLRDDLPGVRAHVCDVGDSAAITQMLRDDAQNMGGLDTLINNAGVAGPTAPIEDVDDRALESCLRVCLMSQFYTIRAALPFLKKSNNPSIINMSSIAGTLGYALRTPYSAAKAGVIGLTQSLALELGEYGIRVNAIAPGLVEGDRQRRVIQAKAQTLGQAFQEIANQATAHTSLGRFIPPGQVADQIAFLISERGDVISGQVISICADAKRLP